MSETCAFCGGPVNPHDLQTWKQVTGWVGGPRKDGMTLRLDSGQYAHDHCVRKARDGQSPDQGDLFGEDDGITVDNGIEKKSISIEEVLEENRGMP
jgi:hypothetical protein